MEIENRWTCDYALICLSGHGFPNPFMKCQKFWEQFSSLPHEKNTDFLIQLTSPPAGILSTSLCRGWTGTVSSDYVFVLSRLTAIILSSSSFEGYILFPYPCPGLALFCQSCRLLAWVQIYLLPVCSIWYNQPPTCTQKNCISKPNCEFYLHHATRVHARSFDIDWQRLTIDIVVTIRSWGWTFALHPVL